MTRISELNPKSSNNAYANLVDNPVLGNLISRMHSAMIRHGHEVENHLHTTPILLQTADIPSLFNKPSTRKDQVVLAKPQIKVFKNHIKAKTTDSAKDEPDIVYMDFNHKVAKIIEVKIGDLFDTSKTKGTVAKLKTFQKKFNKYFPEFTTQIYVCMFYQSDKDKIVNGFKNEISLVQAMTGQEICLLLDVEYRNMVDAMFQHAKENREFFVETMLTDPVMYKIVRDQMPKQPHKHIKKALSPNNNGGVQ